MELVSYTLNILLFNTKPSVFQHKKKIQIQVNGLSEEQHCTETEYSWNTVVFPKLAAFQILFFLLYCPDSNTETAIPIPQSKKTSKITWIK